MITCKLQYREPDKVRKGEIHEDPLVEEFTYGDTGLKNGKKLLETVKENDYLFFHLRIKGKRRITAYYIINQVMKTRDAQANKFITSMYKNPHLHWKVTDEWDTIVFGDIRKSQILKKPLVLKPILLARLSEPPNLNDKQTELGAISSALRTWKQLNHEDINFLLSEIKRLNE